MTSLFNIQQLKGQGYRLIYIICRIGSKMRKIGEPPAGFDLRKRTIADAFFGGLAYYGVASTIGGRCWTMLDDGPMDDTVRLVQLYTRWEKRGAEPSFCITSQQVHAFVSSYPPFHSPSLSIHGIFYQRLRLTSGKPGCIEVCSSLALPPGSIPLPPKRDGN